MTSTRKARQSLNDAAHAIEDAVDHAIHRAPPRRKAWRTVRRTTVRIIAVGGLVAVARRAVARRAATSDQQPAGVAPQRGVAEWPPLVGAIDATVGAAASVDDAAVHGDMPDRVDPVDGVCPVSHPVKGNASSGIYHVPGSRFYDRTTPERCYRDSAAAEADGMRAPKR